MCLTKVHVHDRKVDKLAQSLRTVSYTLRLALQRARRFQSVTSSEREFINVQLHRCSEANRDTLTTRFNRRVLVIRKVDGATMQAFVCDVWPKHVPITMLTRRLAQGGRSCLCGPLHTF